MSITSLIIVVRRFIMPLMLSLIVVSCAGKPNYGNTSTPVTDNGVPEQEHPVTSAAKQRVAASFMEAGDYAGALRLYNQILAANPDDGDALTSTGEIYLRFQAWDEAARRFKAVLATRPDNVRALTGMAQISIAADDTAAARGYLDRAVAAGPDTARLFGVIGVSYDLLGRHVDAQIQYGKGLDLAPADPVLMNDLAISFALAKDYETATRILSGVVTADPSRRQNRQNLAMIYGLSGDLESAKSLLSMDLSGGEVTTRLYYFRQLLAADPVDQARSIFLGTKLPPLVPKSAEAMPPTNTAESAIAEKRGAPATESPVVAGVTTSDKATADISADEAPETRAELPDADNEAISAKRYSVQLGSYQSEAIAMEGWRRLANKYSDLFKGYSAALQKADLGEKGIYYRLYVGEITDLTSADNFCNHLKEQQADCLVRQFPVKSSGEPEQN